MNDSNQKLRPQVILLGLVSLLNDSSSEMIYPLLPVFLTATLGATPVVIGLIEGLADGLSSILKYFAGSFSDRMKRKPFVVSGYALAAVSRALIGIAQQWPSVLVARLLDRTGKGIRSAPRDAIIADVTPVESRGRAFGFHRALDHTGAIIGPLIALALLDAGHETLRTVFLISVIPGVIGVFLLLFLLKEGVRTSRPHASADEDVRRPALPRRFWYALSCIALFSLANSSDAFLLLQAHAAGVATAMLPALWAAHHVIKALFSTRAGSFSDRTDRRRMLAAGWLVYGAIYFVFPFAHSMTFFAILFILYAIPFTLTEGTERAWISDLVPPEAIGRSFGLYYLATGVFVLGGTALFGVLYEHLSPRIAFTTGAVLAAAAAVAVIAGRRGTRAPQSAR